MHLRIVGDLIRRILVYFNHHAPVAVPQEVGLGRIRQTANDLKTQVLGIPNRHGCRIGHIECNMFHLQSRYLSGYDEASRNRHNKSSLDFYPLPPFC